MHDRMRQQQHMPVEVGGQSMIRCSLARRLVVLVLTVIVSWSAFAAPASAQHVLTKAEGVAAGLGFVGDWRSGFPCHTSIDDGPAGTSLVVTVDCTWRPWGSTVAFALFDGDVRLNSPWIATFASSSAGIDTIEYPTRGIWTRTNANIPAMTIVLSATAGQKTSSTIVLSLIPTRGLLPPALPNCSDIFQRPPDFVCSSDNDCRVTDASGKLVLSPMTGKPFACFAACGNRCL